MAENIDDYRYQIAMARAEIKNLRQQLCALKHEDMKDIIYIKKKLQELRCFNCAENATTLASNSNDPSTSSASPSDEGVIRFRPIGIIETSFQNKRGVPRQPSVLAKAKGSVVIDQNVFNNPEHALSGLEEFSHMWIIFHFHATESNAAVPAKVAPPRLGGQRRGVLATRAPRRPCPIGMSLVKIHSIEGNKIHFLGVDMVNGTPVLDIKPYIPQYDYPPSGGGEGAMAALVRPPTEGVSDVADSVAGLQVDDDGFGVSQSPRLINPVGLETSPVSSPYRDEIPSPYEDHTSDPTTPVTPSESPSGDLLDGMRAPVRRLDTERGAPDGQERFTPPQSAHLASMTHDGIRVASWITNPPSQTYEVRFTDDVDDRLTDLISDRAPAFKSSIQNLLAEDPRSTYVRTRYPDHEYSCVLEDLSISCVFDANSSVCTIVAVRTAEDMQQS